VKEVPGLESTDPTVPELVSAAVEGDQSAWDALVVRYTPLVLGIATRFRLSRDDVADVSQTVWLLLVQHLPRLRTPEALPGWIATTTRNECVHVLRSHRRTSAVDPLAERSWDVLDAASPDRVDIDEHLLRAELHEALLMGFAELPDHQRELLELLLQDPPLSYTEISDRLGIPKGSIGPTRARALERLRATGPMVALLPQDPARSPAPAGCHATRSTGR
jgi:RNA polymerase sigma factor (sigma-70 family)